MKYSLQNLVDECQKLLDVGAYFSVLSIALMLPAICSRIEFANEDEYKVVGCDVASIKLKNKDGRFNDRQAYIAWLDKYGCLWFPLSVRNCNNEIDPSITTAESVYDLRCMMLHEGKPFSNDRKVELVVDSNKHGVPTVTILHDKILINMKKLCELLLDVVYIACDSRSEYTDENQCFDVWNTNDGDFCAKYNHVIWESRDKYLELTSANGVVISDGSVG